MVSDLVTIPPQEDVGRAVHIMKEKDVGCLLVVDGNLEGIITERDLLKVF
jgi:CBS domain-containing protein